MARGWADVESGNVRLFIALMPPEGVVEHLDDAVQRLRRLRREEGDVRWVPPQQWHVTLVFLGEVPAESVDELAPALDDVMTHCRRPALQLAGSGTFGSKVLFADVVEPKHDAPSRLLDELAARTREVVVRRGIEVEQRPFRPHLTLARARGGRAAFADVAKGLENYRGPSWTAERVVLVESEKATNGRGSGVVHRTLSTALVGPTP